MGPEIFSPVKAHLATLAIYTWNLILSTSPSSSSCLLQARHRIWPPMPRQLAGAPCPPARRPRLLAGCRRLQSVPPVPPRSLLAGATGLAPPRPAPPSALAGAARTVSPKSPPARASSGRPAPTRMSAGVGSRLRQACPAPSPRMAGGGAEASHAPHVGAVVRRSFGGASNLILCC